jgi:hypothetical protein
MTNNDKLLNELKKIVPKENFFKEPETSFNELKEFELRYNISTFDFINKNIDISHIPIEVQERWINTLETHLVFGGIIDCNWYKK